MPSSESAGAQAGGPLLSYGFFALLALGLLLRILIVALPGNALRTPWGGGGDTPAYVLLAQNLLAGKGYTYAGLPSAYRPPAYPFLLAASMKVFGAHAIATVRWLQFLVGLLTAYLCSLVAGMIFGKAARKLALMVALFFPTLIITTGEILTEALATAMSAIFLYLLVRFFKGPSWATLTGLAASVGLATLVRFNMALFGFVVLWAVIAWKMPMPKWKAAALTILLPGLIISPWLIRNYIAFQGAFVLSTSAGSTAATGVLAPQGRARPGDAERLVRALGWAAPMALETNDPSRLRLGDEADLDRQAWHVTLGLWRTTGSGMVPLTIEKLGYFWLSTDQLLSTDSFRMSVRVARSAGVIFYWALLALGIAGWFKLRKLRPELAHIFLFYAILVTILHIPFCMNTRYRMPFIDPWLAVLVGAALLTGFRLSRGGDAQ
ncbi:MAG TPA: glycosyltransferase family 39 protein [Candidatus Acidoferrales bacterium]|jgi:4-amino-4-deoxy-L-arabinose transferase-like glycosyltransferase|nr:glycosyltransferase family 39 protein [Candidatus Acidoferrales bacterium]